MNVDKFDNFIKTVSVYDWLKFLYCHVYIYVVKKKIFFKK
jgi:hypothetical protein